ncbi:MAG: hypothetical protein RLZZ338_4337 [Cyanobacteriota bacterium]|jgi:hypothetical protein
MSPSEMMIKRFVYKSFLININFVQEEGRRKKDEWNKPVGAKHLGDNLLISTKILFPNASRYLSITRLLYLIRLKTAISTDLCSAILATG